MARLSESDPRFFSFRISAANSANNSAKRVLCRSDRWSVLGAPRADLFLRTNIFLRVFSFHFAQRAYLKGHGWPISRPTLTQEKKLISTPMGTMSCSNGEVDCDSCETFLLRFYYFTNKPLSPISHRFVATSRSIKVHLVYPHSVGGRYAISCQSDSECQRIRITVGDWIKNQTRVPLI